MPPLQRENEIDCIKNRLFNIYCKKGELAVKKIRVDGMDKRKHLNLNNRTQVIIRFSGQQSKSFPHLASNLKSVKYSQSYFIQSCEMKTQGSDVGRLHKAASNVRSYFRDYTMHCKIKALLHFFRCTAFNS